MLPLLLVAAMLQGRVETDAGCIKCHESQADDWKPSVHGKNAVGCVKCHGADEITNKSVPHRWIEGFRRGTKRRSAALCGDCHPKELAHWEGSAHAEDTRDESGKSRGCSSCHAFHETVVAEPRQILKENCSTCHRAGSEAIRFGERYLEIAASFSGGRPQVLRIEQHRLSEVRLRAQAEHLAAYNKSGRPPWLWAIPAVPALAAAVLWLRPGMRRRAA